MVRSKLVALTTSGSQETVRVLAAMPRDMKMLSRSPMMKRNVWYVKRMFFSFQDDSASLFFSMGSSGSCSACHLESRPVNVRLGFQDGIRP